MNKRCVDTLISRALTEDIGNGDITTAAVISQTQRSQAYILAREPAVVCGLELVKKIFKKLDKKALFRLFHADGDYVRANSWILVVEARTRALLTGERVAINCLSRLSGIATKTYRFVQRAKPCKAKILDTRKTTPGMRVFEKYAVRCGGGSNHRYNLNSWILIKDNHRMSYPRGYPLAALVADARRKTKKPVEIEVDNLRELTEVLPACPDTIMLDNMSLATIKKAVKIKRKHKKGKKIALEVSGNVRYDNIRQIAQTGVERISIGGLTHSVKAIDFSLEIVP